MGNVRTSTFSIDRLYQPSEPSQILFLIGLPLIIGAQKTLVFFARKQKIKGTVAFAVGIALILLRWAFLGFIIEAYGIAVLFGDFLWTIASYVQGVPVIGPFVRRLLEMMRVRRGNSELPV